MNMKLKLEQLRRIANAPTVTLNEISSQISPFNILRFLVFLIFSSQPVELSTE